ncbi:unnamed protein product [Umbelopsis ramanniana]
MDQKITHGQACCLVLGVPPTQENRVSSKEYFESSRLTVCYVDSLGPLRPFAMGKDVVARDPFTYQSYITTCHSSPYQALASTSEHLSDVENGIDDNDSIDGETSTDDLLPLTKASVLHILKQIMSDLEPVNKERYEETRAATPKGRVRGRWLWLLKQSYQTAITFQTTYTKHVQATPDVVTIGYARKSHGKESLEKRAELLQVMIDKLRQRCLCRKVYVSPTCSASMPLHKRDMKPDTITADELTHCAGDMHNLLHRLRTNMKPVRLAIIDYAGFSTDFGDLQAFFRKYHQVVEIVVDTEYTFDLMTRAEILLNNNNSISNKFNCRIGPQKRSRRMINA